MNHISIRDLKEVAKSLLSTICLPLGWCICRWVGAFAAGLVRLPLGRLADVRIDFQLFFIGLSWLSLRFHTFSCELCMFV